ncbi:MAG: hypothetical protein Q8M08_03650 [Bacteroidales bacterium]|nr:hypothetical protein [Bacteroidales bacterium]
MGPLLQQLNPTYFWDVDKATLDEQRSKRLIIERVFSLGSLHEIKLINDFYGRKTIVTVLKTLAYLDPKTLNFISVIYGIPKSRFKCYKRRQSTPEFWD